MEEIRVTLSANAGVSIQVNGRRIWVDVLHAQKQDGFSAVTPQLHQQVMHSDAFTEPDCICVTHDHPDHYCRQMIEDALNRWPSAQLCLPWKGAQEIKLDDLTIDFIRLPHEGARYADVEHYGILISTAGKHILLPGDCETASPALAAAIGQRQIDLAILNFPWVALSKGRSFLQNTLKPKHILLCHLPFLDDDINGFRTATQRSAQLLPQLDVRLLSEPVQTQIVNI